MSVSDLSIETWQLSKAKYERHNFDTNIRKELSSLRADDVTGVLYIAKDYAVMAAFVWLTIEVTWFAYPLAVLMIGAHQRGLTTIAHDAAHGTLAKTRWWNQFLGITFAAYPMFQRHWAYRISHVTLHHPHLGDPDKDPDLKFFIDSGVYEVCEPRLYFRRMVLYPLMGLSTIKYLKFLITTRFQITETDPNSRPNRQAFLIDTVGFFGFWLIVISVSAALGGLDMLLLFWIIPYLTASQVLGWFVEIAEHSPMCETENKNIYLTRNRRGNLLERLLFGVNLDEYHLEHHLSPGIPFYHLKKAQKIRLQDPSYRDVAATWGGLFCRGPEGQQSVIAQLLSRNKQLYNAGRV